ncbi:stage VI sporulation protein D [Metabacillus herbersteinensis]|uniref:Stage VI sporulation protein D n=1 Tax=Metabacillus herbersteinensis TaxID=283816 RepID=A0ABV6G941_9BACI
MSQEQQQLRFSVEESVWFQKGQEVSELLSISLDPDISIHEHDQYISVRGALQLTGEYKIDEQEEVGEDLHYANVRYVNEISTREDGVSYLTHRFPVDITIPRNRIQNLEEVYVTIESFDYELPETQCLKLIADLSISGIGTESVQVTATPEAQQEEQFEALYRGPQATAYEDDVVETKEETHEFQEELSEQVRAEEDEEEVEEEEEEEEEVEEEEEEEELVTESFAQNLFANSSEEEQEQDDNKDDLYEPFEVEVRKYPQEVEEKSVYHKPEVQYSLYSAPEKTLEVEQVSNKRSEQKEDQSKSESENSHYLKSLFAREEEDEDFSKLKMCIVQQGDTIDTICERYELTIQQLMRVNDFGAKQDVAEGQILYIPVYATSK